MPHSRVSTTYYYVIAAESLFCLELLLFLLFFVEVVLFAAWVSILSVGHVIEPVA